MVNIWVIIHKGMRHRLPTSKEDPKNRCISRLFFATVGRVFWTGQNLLVFSQELFYIILSHYDLENCKIASIESDTSEECP